MSYRRHRRHLTWLVSYLALLMTIASMPARGVSAQENTPVGESVPPHCMRSQDFRLLINLGVGLGRYDNITARRANLPTPWQAGSSAYLLYLELGMGFRPWGATYYVEAVGSPVRDFADAEGWYHWAGALRHGARAFYRMRNQNYEVAPEGGYVFQREEVTFSDSWQGRPDLYDEECKDEGYAYGLSIGRRLIDGEKKQWWLYGRYVRDNLQIDADNYWVGLQFFDLASDPPGTPGPPLQIMRGILHLRWTARSDGRSDWFLALTVAAEYGLF